MCSETSRKASVAGGRAPRRGEVARQASFPLQGLIWKPWWLTVAVPHKAHCPPHMPKCVLTTHPSVFCFHQGSGRLGTGGPYNTHLPRRIAGRQSRLHHPTHLSCPEPEDLDTGETTLDHRVPQGSSLTSFLIGHMTQPWNSGRFTREKQGKEPESLELGTVLPLCNHHDRWGHL